MTHRITFSHRAIRFFPLAALIAAGGCFATRNDVRVVQSDLATVRTEMLKAAAEQRQALTQAMLTLQVASDSVKVMSNRLTSVQGDVRGGLRDVNAQLIQVQELLKQNEAIIRRWREAMEEQANRVSQPPVTFPTGVPVTAADSAALLAATNPTSGPSLLYATGRKDLARGSWSTARVSFEEILVKYPASDLAPAAQLSIGQTYQEERQEPAAMAAFGAVVSKYPDSPASATARYKMALIYIKQGDTAKARPLLQTIVDRFKTSDEFDLATEQLKKLPPPS